MRLLIYQGFAKWASFFGVSQNFLQVNWEGCLLFWKSWILYISIAISGRISMRRLLTTFRTIYPFKNQKNQTLPQYSCKTDFPNDSRLLPWKSYFSGMKSMAFSAECDVLKLHITDSALGASLAVVSTVLARKSFPAQLFNLATLMFWPMVFPANSKILGQRESEVHGHPWPI